MAWLYDHASPGLDRFFAQVARAGYEGGVIPADILLLAGLAAVGRWRAWRFAAVSLGGSALLVMAAKRLLRRERPALWETIPQETTWSFPSGHATASMALAAVLVLLAWPTRARWPVLLAALAFVPLVGLSRPYLGVHYPSDILAGWCLALAWVAAAWLLLHRRGAAG
ncbi:phosphatase PAP2 family protein [Xanthomonas massiliensis]|uniref:phosphatase PAP2 family protein n=1 Tax=Xanthomonas massiliensis TaxID=1720302 RepID=UPI000824CE47|nr:phosphatase PAP2 family protein [Xanthomonas massiliensis]